MSTEESIKRKLQKILSEGCFFGYKPELTKNLIALSLNAILQPKLDFPVFE